MVLEGGCMRMDERKREREEKGKRKKWTRKEGGGREGYIEKGGERVY